MNVGSAFNGGGVAGFGYDTVERRRKCSSPWPAGSARPTAAGRSSTSCPRPAATPSPAPSSATWPASGRRATTWTTSCGRSAFPAPPRIIRNWDTSFSMGGPIKRDQVWFYGTARTFGDVHRHRRPLRQPERRQPDAGGTTSPIRASRRARPTAGRSSPDASRRSSRRGTRSAPTSTSRWSAPAARTPPTPSSAACAATTGWRCTASARGRRSRRMRQDGRDHIMQFSYTAPVTNKLLLEAAFSQFLSNWNPTDAGRRARPGAVHPGAGAEPRRRRARAQHGLPRLRRAEQQPPDAQRVARVGSPTSPARTA